MLVVLAAGIGLMIFAALGLKGRQHLYLLAVLRRWPDENDVAMRRRELRSRRRRWHHHPRSDRATPTFVGVPQAAIAAGERLAAALDAASEDVIDLRIAVNLGAAAAEEPPPRPDPDEVLVLAVPAAVAARPAARRTSAQWSRPQRRHARRRRR